MTKLNKLLSLFRACSTFSVINFGCRVNAAESNIISQYFLNLGLSPRAISPDLFFINTCAVTQKGEYESRANIKHLRNSNPHSLIVTSGCADLSPLDPVHVHLSNTEKEDLLEALHSSYTPAVSDKFSKSRRYLLKVQSGCQHTCSYCIVPSRRPYSKYLSINSAISAANKACASGYREIIVTGVNLIEYLPGFSNLIEALLTQTSIPLISFGSIPLNCLDSKFMKLYLNYPSRLSSFLHVPIQSGSRRILKLMNRPYTPKTITNTLFKFQKQVPTLKFGTDIIVGFPSETDADFQDTLNLCKLIGFAKIHSFRFSPRPGTPAALLWQTTQVKPSVINSRSRLIRFLIS